MDFSNGLKDNISSLNRCHLDEKVFNHYLQ